MPLSRSIMQEKSAQRAQLRKKLCSLSTEEKSLESQRLCLLIAHYLEQEHLTQANIGIFASTAQEPNLYSLADMLPQAQWHYPRCHADNTLSFHHITDPARELKKGYKDILEPLHTITSTPIKQLDVLLIPALGFTLKGDRLGKGAGFYDRLLNHPDCRALRWGVGFSCQSCNILPTEEHDERLNRIIIP